MTFYPAERITQETAQAAIPGALLFRRVGQGESRPFFVCQIPDGKAYFALAPTANEGGGFRLQPTSDVPFLSTKDFRLLVDDSSCREPGDWNTPSGLAFVKGDLSGFTAHTANAQFFITTDGVAIEPGPLNSYARFDRWCIQTQDANGEWVTVYERGGG